MNETFEVQVNVPFTYESGEQTRVPGENPNHQFENQYHVLEVCEPAWPGGKASGRMSVRLPASAHLSLQKLIYGQSRHFVKDEINVPIALSAFRDSHFAMHN